MSGAHAKASPPHRHTGQVQTRTQTQVHAHPTRRLAACCGMRLCNGNNFCNMQPTNQTTRLPLLGWLNKRGLKSNFVHGSGRSGLLWVVPGPGIGTRRATGRTKARARQVATGLPSRLRLTYFKPPPKRL